MKWEEFSYIFFYENFYEITCTFFIILILLYIIFYKNIYSIYDPLNMMVISLAACYAVIYYLKVSKRIDDMVYFQLFFINISFIISYKYFINKKQINISKLDKYLKFEIFYYYHTVLFIILFLLFFKFIGLNIFQNKFSAFENIGIINYLRRALVPGELILLLIKRELYKKKSKIDKYIFILIFILFIFNGGKASIISLIMYIYAMYYNFYRTNSSNTIYILKKYEKIILILAIISLFFLTKIIYKEVNYYEVLKRILFRIISYGDTYYMLYPSKLYEKLNIPNLTEYYLYRLVLPILRKIGYEGNALGFLIVEKLYNIDRAWTGPNTRADIILQLNLGYLGIIGAVISAKIMSILRRISSKNYLILYIIINLFVINETIMMDFSILAMSLIGIVLIICPGIILVEFLYIILKINRKEKYE